MTKKRGLSNARGLDVLIGTIKKEQQVVAQPSDDVALIQINVAALQSGKYQPRKTISEPELAELAASIARHGVMQPIVIRPLLPKEASDNGITHEIIAGERRWRAAKLAGLATIPAIHRVLSDELAIALALIENIQREDLSVLEQAEALARFNTEFGMSHAMIAEVVGKARTTVSNLLRLNQLHDTVKGYMAQNLLDMGHARTLLSLPSDEQPQVAKKIIDGAMTVRQAEKLVKTLSNPSKAVKISDPDIAHLEQDLTDSLGVPVKVKGKGGRGSVELFFHSEAELTALLQFLTTKSG